jgi:transcription elongation factor GreB
LRWRPDESAFMSLVTQNRKRARPLTAARIISPKPALKLDSPDVSRAFVKEDIDLPERSARRRSASGLPPGAVNYLTARGAAQLRADLARLRENGDTESATEIERILASAKVVEPPAGAARSVTFGATVTTRVADGATQTYQVVGVDEVGLWPDAVAWVSPMGRALLGARRGDKVSLDGGTTKVTIDNIEHR